MFYIASNLLWAYFKSESESQWTFEFVSFNNNTMHLNELNIIQQPQYKKIFCNNYICNLGDILVRFSERKCHLKPKYCDVRLVDISMHSAMTYFINIYLSWSVDRFDGWWQVAGHPIFCTRCKYHNNAKFGFRAPQDDYVIKWGHFPRYWPFVWRIHRSRLIPLTKASDAELWCFLWSAPEQTAE